MRQRLALLAPLLTFLAMGGTPAAADLGSAACSNIRGHVSGFGIPQFDTAGNLAGFHVIVTESTGDLADATVTADLSVVFAGAGGAMHLDGSHYFVDPATGLNIVTDDYVRISPNGVVNDTLRVISGGTGMLHTHGSVDLATGAVDLDLHGRLCT